MKHLFAILITTCCFYGFAQTDIVEYRSHSGNMSKFTKYSTPKIDGVTTNFGAYRMPEVKTAALDTVRFISECEVVMVTSEYCNAQFQVDVDDEGNLTRRRRGGDFWSAGSDTMLNHPLFNRRHSLDSIKHILKTTYNFQNSIDSVVFIGYDNSALEINDTIEEENVKPKELDGTTKGDFGLILLASILLPALLIYILGPLAYNWAKN
ncbi:MAG: hypothetical protein ACI837_000730 [Crocinitomicaceae bacterium]|jgi:hypothetical protein